MAYNDVSFRQRAVIEFLVKELTLEKIEKMGWEVLPHPPYSPDLAPSDYHLFGFVKNQMRCHHYETNEALQTAVRQCLRAAGMEFYCKGIFKLPEQ